jgi:hypothetical protein
MNNIFINSPRAQAESEALLRSLELSVQLLSTIRKEGLTIYQYRPSVNFEKPEGADSAKVKFSYAYKYHHISVGNYPAFTSTQNDTYEGIQTAIKEVIDQVRLYQRAQTQLAI